MPTAILTFILAFALQAAGVMSLKPTAPKTVGKIDTGKLKGEPTQLAWSPDGSQFFLQTSERDNQAMVKNPRFFLLAGTDASVTPLSAAPAWAQEYWQWKAGQTPPGSKAMTIDVKRGERTGTATSAPMGGSLARGGANGDPNTGTTVDDVATRNLQMQKSQVITLTLKDEVVGEFVNTQFLPGYTFGWAPQGSTMIAYRNQGGHLGIMDEHEKQEVSGTKDVLLPAWSADGSKIAFLQRTGKNKYDLVVVTVKP